MKSFGLLPSSPMVKDMTEIQWAYCYLNIAKDLEEEDNLFRMRAKYQGLFVNPDAVKKISEEEEKQKRHTAFKNNGFGLTERQEEIIDSGGAINMGFEEELQKALQGEQFMEIPIEGSVRGDSTMSSDDFLAQCMLDFEEENNENKDKNINESEEDTDIIIVDDDDE